MLFYFKQLLQKKHGHTNATGNVYDPQGIYGTTTTFAGNVDATSLTNGTGPGATFFLPTGIVCDASGKYLCSGRRE